MTAHDPETCQCDNCRLERIRLPGVQFRREVDDLMGERKTPVAYPGWFDFLAYLVIVAIVVAAILAWD